MRHFQEKFVTVNDLETFLGPLLEYLIFLYRYLKLWTFWEFLSNNTIWETFWKTLSQWVILIHVKALFRKNQSFFSKNKKFERFRNLKQKHPLRGFLDKNVTVSDLEACLRFFPIDQYFFRKKQFSERFQNSYPILVLETHSRKVCHSQQSWNIPEYFIEKTRFSQKRKRKNEGLENS